MDLRIVFLPLCFDLSRFDEPSIRHWPANLGYGTVKFGKGTEFGGWRRYHWAMDNGGWNERTTAAGG
jgi:hypothetical protein